MEVEEVQVKLEDEAKASSDNSEKVLVDKELLEILFSILLNPTDSYHFWYKRFYIVNKDKKVEYFYAMDRDGWKHARWNPIDDAGSFGYAKNEGFLCPELSNLSFEEIKKLGETQEPGVYFKGKKVWDL